ncbi:hypothetical protein C2869_07635 [Saccharobesus litoralis]|uniref:Uncharacterized protein n=1 Tax=Saccharobesus litoralis TaxID=2172099 RepID=A0A2S0VQ16_9ALTE|nr:hypothetical protein [Saccharobesus litoralis]AWB66311.1 hypothetical protein C2869_07635 [Saccharobesus litoralis]
MTAFINGKCVPYDKLIKQKDQGDIAYTGTKNGAMLVPITISKDELGEVRFTVKDRRFASLEPEEVQQF